MHALMHAYPRLHTVPWCFKSHEVDPYVAINVIALISTNNQTWTVFNLFAMSVFFNVYGIHELLNLI